MPRLLFVAGILAGCAGPDRDGRAPFDPEYFLHSEHLALRLDSRKGELVTSDPMIVRRPGPAPSRPPDAGSMTLTYRDSSGNELGHYSLYDPLSSLARERYVELPLPANPEIASVELSPLEGRVLRFDVGAAVRRALAPGR